MFMQDKLDRAMKWLKERNKIDNSVYENDAEKYLDENLPEDYDPRKEWMEEEEEIKLEKGDVLALILAAIIVFGPIFLVLFLILILVMRI